MSDLTIRVREGERARALARSLKRRVPALNCPACGRRDFALLEQPEAALRTVLAREVLDGERDAQGEPKKQPLVTLLCTNCGHLEQFAEAVLQGAVPAAYGEQVEDG